MSTSTEYEVIVLQNNQVPAAATTEQWKGTGKVGSYTIEEAKTTGVTAELFDAATISTKLELNIFPTLVGEKAKYSFLLYELEAVISDINQEIRIQFPIEYYDYSVVPVREDEMIPCVVSIGASRDAGATCKGKHNDIKVRLTKTVAVG